MQAVGAKIDLIKLHNIIHVAKSGKKGLLITHFVFITPCAQEGQGVHLFANQTSLHKAKSASFATRYMILKKQLWISYFTGKESGLKKQRKYFTTIFEGRIDSLIDFMHTPKSFVVRRSSEPIWKF